jgi:hypothetical protein
MGVAAAASGTNDANRSSVVHTYIYTHTQFDLMIKAIYCLDRPNLCRRNHISEEQDPLFRNPIRTSHLQVQRKEMKAN